MLLYVDGFRHVGQSCLAPVQFSLFLLIRGLSLLDVGLGLKFASDSVCLLLLKLRSREPASATNACNSGNFNTTYGALLTCILTAI